MVRKTTQRERNTGRPALSDSDRRTLDGLDRFTLGSSFRLARRATRLPLRLRPF